MVLHWMLSLIVALAMSRRSLFSKTFMMSTSSSLQVGLAKPTKKKSLRVMIHGGDNMLGRAVQLTFPVQAPGGELIRDSCTAQHYLVMGLHRNFSPSMLNEIRNQNQNDGSYLWGHAKIEMEPPPDVRLLNLETAVTKSIDNRDIPQKGINYHMHCDNFETILGGFVKMDPSPVVVNFANNHGLDYGRKALEEETLPLFDRTSSSLLQIVGCGRNFSQAARPVEVPIDDNGQIKVQVYGFATACSGTPRDWGATKRRSGVVSLPALYNRKEVEEAMSIVKEAMVEHGGSADEKAKVRVVSIHWGPNWAMRGENEKELQARRELAHRLIDECGVDLIYGHSSHHVRGMEVYHNKLILYGAGDIINDYEGFENRGEERYITMGGVFVVDLDAATADFEQLRLVPMYMNQLRLERFTKDSLLWRPNENRYEKNANKSKEFCAFINDLSKNDAGSGNHALMLEHFDKDTQIPGGPVLRSKRYGI